MKGKVLAAAAGSSPGLISGDDGQRYQFDGASARNGLPRPGQEVDFEVSNRGATEIYIVSGQSVISPEARRGWLNFYFNPTGRVSRRQYWLYGVLATFLVSLVLGWVPIVGQILGLAAFWSSIALSFKRCHDVGRSGWWSFMPAIPLLLTIVAAIVEGSQRSAMAGTMLLAAVTFASYLWLFITVYVRRGDHGSNRFGQDPADLPIA